jgi:hypothetical protein
MLRKGSDCHGTVWTVIPRIRRVIIVELLTANLLLAIEDDFSHCFGRIYHASIIPENAPKKPYFNNSFKADT